MIWLADPEDAGKAGPFGLLAIIILGVACYFLFKSMSRHLKKVRETYPDPGVDMTTHEQGPISLAEDRPAGSAAPSPRRTGPPPESSG